MYLLIVSENMSAPKSLPLTRSEVMNLLELIVAHPVVLNKVNSVANNQLKESAWRQITEIFNESFANIARKPETLRLKWQNLKKAARKRMAIFKKNKFKNGAGMPEHIPADDALDRVAAILDPTFQSLPATLQSLPATLQSLPATPQSVPSQQKSSKVLGKLICQPNAGVITSRKRKNKAIAVYYEEKLKQEVEIFKLRKRKMELEICNLEIKLDS